MASCLNSFPLGSKDRISQHIKYFSKPDLNYRINISKPQTKKCCLCTYRIWETGVKSGNHKQRSNANITRKLALIAEQPTWQRHISLPTCTKGTGTSGFLNSIFFAILLMPYWRTPKGANQLRGCSPRRQPCFAKASSLKEIAFSYLWLQRCSLNALSVSWLSITLFFYKNVVFLAQAEYFFFCWFWLKILLHHS